MNLTTADLQRWQLLDLVAAPMLVRDPAGAILHLNPAAAALYGSDLEQARGQMADVLLHNASNPAPAAMLATLLAGAAQASGECTRRAADGSELSLALHWRAQRDASGQLIAIIETATDVGERLRAQSALAQSEYRYHNLFHAMAASFWELDFTAVGRLLKGLRKSGVHDLAAHLRADPALIEAMLKATRVLDVNEQSRQLFGLPDTAVEGDIAPFWPQHSWPIYAQSVLAAISGASSYAAETRLRRADGSEFEAWFTACFAPETVGTGRLLIGILDISARVRAQDQARQLQDQLAHAARVAMLGELTASIAHEINQPLAAIATHGEAGLRWLNRPQPELDEVRAALEHTVADARRAAGIIGRTRALAQRRALTLLPLTIDSVVCEALGFLDHTLRAQQVQVRLDLAGGLPEIRADRIQLQQVLVNLLVNALQAMAGAGCQSPQLCIRSRPGGDGTHVLVQVEDNGPGIDPALLPTRLFDSFRSTRTEGLGLGLAVARSIVEAHGGRVEAGNLSVGACLSLVLPVAA